MSVKEQEHSWLEMSRDNWDYIVLCVFIFCERDALGNWCFCGNVCTVNNNKRYFNLKNCTVYHFKAFVVFACTQTENSVMQNPSWSYFINNIMYTLHRCVKYKGQICVFCFTPPPPEVIIALYTDDHNH